MKTIFSYKNDLCPLAKLAMPLIAVGIMQSGINFFETLFFAHLGPDVLAAGALGIWLFGVIFIVLFGTLSSINVLIAYQYGAKEYHQISLVLRDGFIVAGILLVPTFLLVWFIPPILIMLGQAPFVVLQATAYLHPLAWGLLPFFVSIVFLEFLLGLGQTRIVMLFAFVSTPIIVLASYILIFGKWGLPALHIAGAGWGITIGDAISMLILLAYISCSKKYKKYWQGMFQLKTPSFIVELLRVGLPIGFMYCLEIAFFFVLMLFMGVIGTNALAANQLVLQYSGLVITTVFNVAQAITTRMGHELGAKNKGAAQRAAYAGIMLTVVLMLVAAVIFCYFPRWLISADLDVLSPINKDIVQYAIEFFAIAALFQIFEGTRIAVFGALRAYKDTRYTLIVSIISFWGISLPLGYLLCFNVGLGGVGFWWGMVIGSVIGVSLLFYRLQKKKELL